MGVEKTANAITTVTTKLKAFLTSFNNEMGEDGSGRGLRNLFLKYGLSNPPTEPEYDALYVLDKIRFQAELQAIKERALSIEVLYRELVGINPGSGVFNSIAEVKAWVAANMGLEGKLTVLGADITKNCDVFLAIRPKLQPMVETMMLKAHSDALIAFRDENTIQVPNLGTE